jgi:hypothetical protein
MVVPDCGKIEDAIRHNAEFLNLPVTTEDME